MAVTLTTGDHVRINATGEIMVVDGLTELAGTTFLLVSRYGQMAGAFQAQHEQQAVRRDEVTKVVGKTEWIEAE